jgi:hypothetical protein
LPEVAIAADAVLPSDFNQTNNFHGSALVARQIAEDWAKSGIFVSMSSLTGSTAKLNVFWQYMNNPLLATNFPDLKMSGTNDISGTERFSDLSGVYQKDIRRLSQGTENNGQRLTTYFAPGIANPWGYSGTTTKQTASQILWALSGAPKATDPAKRDSKLGQVGEDPAGLMPVHDIVLMWNMSSHQNSPTIDDWHKAIDTFGPPGTFAFPYLPPGY